MKQHPSQPEISRKLATAAAAYQAAMVIPHCPSCRRPCCRLDTLVLDLEWKQIKLLWQGTNSRGEFDRKLDQGKGPQEIRRADGRYYVHSKPCPAYDEQIPGCRIYDHPLKPQGCSDFPVYEDAGAVIADLRCEAVALDQLANKLAEAMGPEYRLQHTPDHDFPFLVELTPKASKARRTAPG